MNSQAPAFYRPPGRPGVQQSEVDEAAEDLFWRQEIFPSVPLVRRITGGSNSTLKPMLTDWEARLFKRLKALKEGGTAAIARLPESLVHDLEVLYLRSIDEARKAADTELSGNRDALARKEQDVRDRQLVLTEREREFQARLDEQARVIGDQADQVRVLTSMTRRLQTQKDAAENDARTLKDELSAARVRAPAKKSRTTQTQKARTSPHKPKKTAKGKARRKTAGRTSNARKTKKPRRRSR